MSKVSICIRVVEVLRSRQSNAGFITIGVVVFCALYEAQMGGLMDSNMSLVDRSASPVQGCIAEPSTAVDNVILRGQGVCDDTSLAVVVPVSAVDIGLARGLAISLSHLAKGAGNSVAGVLACTLKVLSHLLGRTGPGSFSSLDCNVVDILAGSLKRRALGTGAVILNGSPLHVLMERQI